MTTLSATRRMVVMNSTVADFSFLAIFSVTRGPQPVPRGSALRAVPLGARPFRPCKVGRRFSGRAEQPVVKVRLHSIGNASPLHPTALENARRGPRFSVVTPCHRGGAAPRRSRGDVRRSPPAAKARVCFFRNILRTHY